MYRAIIVDDEPRIRRGLTSLIPKLDPEWSVAGEAKNGMEALDLVRKEMPDLVITDIRMPKMNGLDLLSALKEYPVRVVILSGYGYFEYAQTAVKFGAFDYLLKPVKPPEIKSLLQRVKERRGADEASAKPARDSLNYSKWWKDWLLEEEDARSYEDKLKSLLPAEAEELQLLAVEIDRYEELIGEDQWGDKQLVAFAVRNVIQELAAESRESELLPLFASGPRILYLTVGKALNPDAARILIEKVGKWVKISISIGLSGTTKDFRELPALFRQASEALRDKWIRGEGIASLYEDGANIAREALGYPVELDEAICRELRAGDPDKALEGLERFLLEVASVKQSYPIFQRFALQLLSSVYRIVYENRIDDAANKGIIRPQELFRREFSVEEYRLFMTEWFVAIAEALEWRRKQRNNRTIEKAIEFIRGQYARDISLEEVAHQAGMSSSYFSTFFKQETGDNFVEYLTRLRIEKAKALMTDAELRLYEISRLVGYQDVKYFSRLFKRHVGATPAEYRQFFYRKEEGDG
ncbi:response regulator [Cohnella thailandensis]|uniref:Response regulator n=1 Tax=Cohnella thailandensis TaxID=557557 RepID=A0A841T239_9BACL|nr:response regulator [Cohnella thailandensis]MBB6636916.1 response regulator [Cohnella thailandensis]MBP1973203.1 two-component system response regulator YesN [Cohnella thailandensis]